MASRRAVIAAAVVAFLTGILIGSDPVNAPRLLIEFGGIVVSTFVGAWAAFRLQTQTEEAKTRAGNAGALRRAQFALVEQFNVLETLRRGHLGPLRADPNRDLLLGPLAFFYEIPSIDLSSLAFLLESSPNRLQTLLMCQNLWNSVIGLLRQQSREFRRYQARMDEAVRAGLMAPREPPQKIRDLVGPEITGALRTLTDGLYEKLDQALEANETSFNNLAQQMTLQFPGERPLKREVDRVVTRTPVDT